MIYDENYAEAMEQKRNNSNNNECQPSKQENFTTILLLKEEKKKSSAFFSCAFLSSRFLLIVNVIGPLMGGAILRIVKWLANPQQPSGATQGLTSS
jgi:hypothetical protein